MNNIVEKFKLKKFLLLLLISILCCGVFVIHRTVAEDTTPGNPAFDDTNFYKCVINAYNEANDAEETIKSNLTDEQLQTITELVCNGSPMLGHSQVKLSTKGLEKLTELQSLSLIQYLLDDISLDNLTKLTSLTLFYSKIPSINVSKNTKLTKLNLQGGNLTSIDISHNLELTELNLSVNKLTTLPKVELLTKLTKLDILNNEFTTVPNITNLTSLQYLDLGYNHLTNIPSLQSLTNLQYLYLSHNELTSVPGLQALTNLKRVKLANNKLTSDPNFQNLNLLEELYIEYNNLTSLTSLNGLQNLEILYASNNKLSEIDLLNNPNLRNLDLEHNSLDSINLSKTPFLKFLNLSYNKLSTIDLKANTKLNELVIENNKIANIDLSKNILLTNIILDGNKLTSLNVNELTELETISAGVNEITNIDVNNNSKLKILNLPHNKLSKLNITNESIIHNLLILNIEDNTLLSHDFDDLDFRSIKEQEDKVINSTYNGYYNTSLQNQSFNIYLPYNSQSYEVDLKKYDSNLDPSRITMADDLTHSDGKFTFDYKPDSIRYVYGTRFSNMFKMSVTINLYYVIFDINSFYIGNTENDAYTNTRNVKVNLAWDKENITHYCISTENSSEHCEWKDASNQSVSGDYTLTSDDGEKTLYAFIKNSDGIISNSKSDSITLDTTKPIVQSVYIGGSNNPVYATNTSSNIYFTYQDSDVASYCIKDTNDSSNCTWNNVNGNTMNVSYTLTSNNGSKVVYVFLKDRAGNISLGKEDTIILDTINPTIDKFYIGGSNNPDVITDTNTNIYLSWQDEDVASYCIKTENDISNCVWNNVNGKSINASYNIDEVNGTKTLYAFIKDKAGLVSSVKSDNVLLDSKKPVIDIFYIGGRTNPEVIGDTNTIVYLKWSDTDVVKFCINTENNANNCTWNNTSNQEVETEYILPGVNGLRTLYAFLKDSSGLISNGKSDTITLNSTKPLIKSFIINNNAKYTTNKEINYKLITEENNIVSYCINTVNSSNNCNWITNSNQEINGNYTLNNNDGNKTLYVYLKNNLDVISNVASDSIILDTTKPVIDEFFIGGVNNPTYINNKNTTIYSVFKDLDVVSYCINTINDSNNCTWNTISSNKINTNYTISNNDGNITLYLFLKDEAGLISNSKSDNVILDTEKPTVKDFYFGNTIVNNEKILLEITIMEDDVISYCVSDKNNSNNCKWKEVTSKNIKEEYILTGGNGEKSIYVYLKDKAGNITSSKELKITLQKSNVGSSVDNNLNENEADKPLNNSPQTGGLKISILIILLAITSIYCFIKFKKKNYIFKV